MYRWQRNLIFCPLKHWHCCRKTQRILFTTHAAYVFNVVICEPESIWKQLHNFLKSLLSPYTSMAGFFDVWVYTLMVWSGFTWACDPQRAQQLWKEWIHHTGFNLPFTEIFNFRRMGLAQSHSIWPGNGSLATRWREPTPCRLWMQGTGS